jgi:hypothetical protein
MSSTQKALLDAIVYNDRPTEFHHGDCVGADAEAHDIATQRCVRVVIHPPTEDRLRAFCDVTNGQVLKPRPYIDRNHDIVDSCDVLVAAPRTDTELVRSGTWATIRYARKQGKLVSILPRHSPFETEAK